VGNPSSDSAVSCQRLRPPLPDWVPWGPASCVPWARTANDISALSALDEGPKSVEGFRTIAARISRPRRMRSGLKPATMRSEGQRLGDRLRERLRDSSCCLTSTDSATMERVPPGPASRATVASRWRKRTARSRRLNPSKIATPKKIHKSLAIRHGLVVEKRPGPSEPFFR